LDAGLDVERLTGGKKMPDDNRTTFLAKRRSALTGFALLLALLGAACVLPIQEKASAGVDHPSPIPATQTPEKPKSVISIDYPEEGSIFPPGITPPTFIWRDSAATSWKITISFDNHAPTIRALARGQHMHFGPIDPDAIASTNELPKLTPEQAASWIWTPDAATWSAMQLHSTAQPATVTIIGYRRGQTATSQSHVSFTTSTDPVGAPVFFRDVPLMPSEGKDGIVQPLPDSAIHLIKWRIRDITKPESHTVLTGMPTCVNCHSFSRDGKTMGIDVDGPNNDKGLYAVVPISKHISISNKDVVQWNTDGKVGKIRVGFMSQVSPDGQTVISTFAGPDLDVPSTFYVRNFKDYRFLQVFYPTRGILEWYSRATGRRQPLPGADDSRYVQTDGVWSPDGKWIIFARATARDPREPGQQMATYANDPLETKIQFDLYRIPFNDGRGGTPERIVGASENGMSNNFPKVSPDGRWIVFVQCHNGQLMRPDSKLYIIPFEGGNSRMLRANTWRMNSWHSFSPNGRWLVFSSKARSPYTQMVLTHIDPNGIDSPPIFVDNATASNRAVNLPEFVNIAGDGIDEIKVPAVDVYALMGQAMRLEEKQQYAEALEIWKKAVTMAPDDAKVQNDLAANLYLNGEASEAIEILRKAIQINPELTQGHYNLGAFLLQQGHPDLALPELETAVSQDPRFPSGEATLAGDYGALGRNAEALGHWRKALVLTPKSVIAHVGAARILSSASDDSLRNGSDAVALAQQANDLTFGTDPTVLDTLGAAYAEEGQFPKALESAHRALDFAVAKGDTGMANAIRFRINLYEQNKPFRN
jgi:tetratricopeptide (TPR) repeat protein